jgi:hypothetical protein
MESEDGWHCMVCFWMLWNKEFNKAKLSAEHYNAAFAEMTHQKEKKIKKGLVNIKNTWQNRVKSLVDCFIAD